MLTKILLLTLGIAILLGLYPNIYVGFFGIYLLDLAVLLIFIYSFFFRKYRIKAFDLFIFFIFITSVFFLLLNMKLLFSYSSFLYLFRLCIYFLTYPFFIFVAKNYKKFAINTYLLVLLSILVGNLIVFGFFPNLNILGFDPHKFRLYGQFLDPNYYSVFLALNIHVILNNFNSYSKIKVPVLILAIFSLFLTLSRLGLIVGVVVFLFFILKNRKMEFIIIFCAIILLLFVSPTYISRFLFTEGNFESFFYRILDFVDGLDIYFKSTIPQGFNNMGIYNSYYNSTLNNASSYYDIFPLNIMLSGGLLYIFAFTIFFIYLSRTIQSIYYRQVLFLILIASFGMNIFFYPLFLLCFSAFAALGKVNYTVRSV